MREQRNAYFFSTNLVRWVLHVFFLPFEGLETGDIMERVDKFAYRLEDLGAWLLDEGYKAGISFLENGKLKSIFELKGPQEEKATSWVMSLETLSKSVPLDEQTQHFYLYYLECDWAFKILISFNDFVCSLEVSDLVQSYLDVEEQFKNQREWLEAQLRDISKNYLPQDQLDELNKKKEQINNDLVADWRATVISYSRKYS